MLCVHFPYCPFPQLNAAFFFHEQERTYLQGKLKRKLRPELNSLYKNCLLHNRDVRLRVAALTEVNAQSRIRSWERVLEFRSIADNIISGMILRLGSNTKIAQCSAIKQRR
jgi:hypothetical protein